jgi:Tfp pilus assembly protein PilF/NAD-dependent SIR2 family protein deacetylase
LKERSVKAIAAILQTKFARGCTLLVGAGCSASAGIPLAHELIEKIKEMDPDGRADEEKGGKQFTYGDWMDRLGTEQRHTMLAHYIDEAKINWAHICMASLMASGHVDRILTTNFDPLLVQSCALFGEFPAVYDFAASQFLRPQMIPPKAVFYLHGQRSGFVLKNTHEELQKHAAYLKPIIDDSLRGRIWIVVGYSGLNDPVFELLTNIDEFDFNLYWIGYKEDDPAEHVRTGLLDVPGKRAYYTRGYDADHFFDELIRELNIYPPKLVAKPFTHFNEILNRVTPEERFRETREMIQKAIQQFEQTTVAVQDGRTKEASLIDEAQQLMNAGDYDGLIRLRPKYDAAPSQAGADYLSRAYLMKGNEYAEKAKAAVGGEAEQLFLQAMEQYRVALNIKADFAEVLNNWGAALYAQANKRGGEQAAEILAEARAKFDQAIAIKPENDEVLINRGTVLSDLSMLKQGEESDDLFKQAIQDFSAALRNKPNSHEVLSEWGETLRKRATAVQAALPEEAESLLNQASQKYQEALKIKPEDVKALNGWGNMLLLQSETKDSETQELLVNKAMDKFFEADMRQPGSSAYYLARHKGLSGDEWGCRESLKRAKQYNKLPSREYILRDMAFANVSDEDWFIQLLEQP